MTLDLHRRRIGHAWAWCLPNGILHREDGPAVERDDGTIEWHRHGLRHREGGPAVVTPDQADGQPGWQEWWVKGRRHRAGGPAFVCGDSEEWWSDGQLHRDDGPAWIKGGHAGDRRWYCRGVLHRDDGPAVEYSDGTVEFYVAGQLHRLDGPARDYVGGVHEWFVRAKRIPAEGSDVLEELFRRREITTLTHVLSAWRPHGPTPAELLNAVRAAQA